MAHTHTLSFDSLHSKFATFMQTNESLSDGRKRIFHPARVSVGNVKSERTRTIWHRLILFYENITSKRFEIVIILSWHQDAERSGDRKSRNRRMEDDIVLPLPAFSFAVQLPNLKVCVSVYLFHHENQIKVNRKIASRGSGGSGGRAVAFQSGS